MVLIKIGSHLINPDRIARVTLSPDGAEMEVAGCYESIFAPIKSKTFDDIWKFIQKAGVSLDEGKGFSV